MAGSIVREKISQATDILKEKGIDLWLTFVRETETLADPCLELILGKGCTWKSAFIITSGGETVAVVGNLDEARIRQTGVYREIRSYVDSVKEPLLEVIQRVNPRKIAVNYSPTDYIADGLTHGMYLSLCSIFKGTPYADRFVPSSEVISALRGRKSTTEIDRLKQAAELALSIFRKVTTFAKAGMSEQELAKFVLGEVDEAGVETSWEVETCPSVFTGPDTAGAHFGPTERKIARGHILNIDFGVRVQDYCSDLQRTWYVLEAGEEEAPDEVEKGFEVIRESIRRAAGFLKPGIMGWEVDKVVREYIVSQGYEEYPHALGHQIGRKAHDGAGVLAPRWDRYQGVCTMKVEAGQVYTIEPRLTVSGRGVVTVEEEVVVTDEGCEFLSEPQDALWFIR